MVEPTVQYAYVTSSGTYNRLYGSEVIYRSTWSGSLFYNPNEVVDYLSGMYYCLTPNSNQPPTANIDARWSAFVQTSEEEGLTLEQLYVLILATGSTAYQAIQLAWAGTQAAYEAGTLAQIAYQAGTEGYIAGTNSLVVAQEAYYAGTTALALAQYGTELAYTALTTAWTGTNSAYTALTTAWSATNTANTALSTAWYGTSLANEALTLAQYGTDLAYTALTTAWTGTSTANTALTTAQYGTDLAYTALTTAWTGTETANNITLNGTVASNGSNVTIGRSGTELQFKTLIPGTDVYIEDYGTALEIGSTGGGGGEANTASTLAGIGLTTTKVGTDLPFKGLEAGTNVQISATGTTVVISAGTTLASEGEAYTFVGGSSNSTTNGTQLVAAYAAAKTKTPHGSALSNTNRYTIYLLPGQYTLSDGALDLDTDYINIEGIDNRNAYLTSNGDTLKVTVAGGNIKLANMTIHTSAAATNTDTGKHAFSPEHSSSASTFRAQNILFTSDNNFNAMKAGVWYGDYIDCECDVDGGFNCSYQVFSGTVSLLGNYVRCKATGDYTFGYAFNTATFVNLSGWFINCEAVASAFGGSGSPTLDGVFIGCKCNSTLGICFGSPTTSAYVVTMSGYFQDCVDVGTRGAFGVNSVRGDITLSGRFFNCSTNGVGFGAVRSGVGSHYDVITVSGYFVGCYAASNAFGGGIAGTGSKVVSGEFHDCHAGALSFGGLNNTTVSGKFYNCHTSAGQAFGIGTTAVVSGEFHNCVAGGAGSFGGRDGGNPAGTASGIFIGCTAGEGAFGSSQSSTGGTMSGRMLNCLVLGKMNASMTGIMEGCRIESQGANDDALVIAAAGRVYGCTLLATGTGYSITGTGSISASVGHTRMNTGIDPGFTFTNNISTPYNIVDASLA